MIIMETTVFGSKVNKLIKFIENDDEITGKNIFEKIKSILSESPYKDPDFSQGSDKHLNSVPRSSISIPGLITSNRPQQPFQTRRQQQTPNSNANLSSLLGSIDLTKDEIDDELYGSSGVSSQPAETKADPTPRAVTPTPPPLGATPMGPLFGNLASSSNRGQTRRRATWDDDSSQTAESHFMPRAGSQESIQNRPRFEHNQRPRTDFGRKADSPSVRPFSHRSDSQPRSRFSSNQRMPLNQRNIPNQRKNRDREMARKMIEDDDAMEKMILNNALYDRDSDDD